MPSDVLVVDPGELGELLSTLFLQHGLTATCAKGGEQALEVALRERPGAVVIEYDLPDADGLDVAELLRDELGAKIVITYAQHDLSGADRDQLLARMGEFDASFARPFRSRSLIQRVAELLGHGIAPSETTSELAIPDVTAEEPLLLEEEVPDAGRGNEEEDDLVVEIDIQHLGDEQPPGHELGYGPPPKEAEPPAPPPAPQKRPPPAPSGPREGVSVPISELENEKDRAKTGSHRLVELLAAARERGPLPDDAASAAAGSPLGEREGRLTPRALSDVLDAFHQSQTTGEIWLARGQAQRVLLLVRGVIIGARTNLAGERLAHLLERHGGPWPGRLEALRKSLPEGTSLEADTAFKRVALERRLLDEALLLRLLGEQTRRIVLGAFMWRDGVYKVTLTGHGKREKRRVVLSVADAILRGALLTESMEALREAAPDDVRFAPNPDAPYGLEQLTLSPEEARVVVALDGTKTMSDIETLYPEVSERTRRGLAAGLLRLELLRFAGKGHAEARRISFF